MVDSRWAPHRFGSRRPPVFPPRLSSPRCCCRGTDSLFCHIVKNFKACLTRTLGSEMAAAAAAGSRARLASTRGHVLGAALREGSSRSAGSSPAGFTGDSAIQDQGSTTHMSIKGAALASWLAPGPPEVLVLSRPPRSRLSPLI